MTDTFTAYSWFLIWLGLLIIIVVFTIPALRSIVNKTHLGGFHLPAVIERARYSARAFLFVVGLRIILMGTGSSDRSWYQVVDHGLSIALIIAVVWFLTDVAVAIEGLLDAYFTDPERDDDATIRRIKTQIRLIRRLVVALLVIVGAALVLMTFPEVDLIGRSVLASAGLVSIVAGLAAQTSLANGFAGIQLALSSALKVGDVVSVNDESGIVDDITLTYVVVSLWDDRRLILPSSYFISTPFENWTRSGDRIGGSVFFDVEWTAPIARMREELARILSETPLWDGRSGSLTVADARGGYIRVRVGLSARDTDTLFELKAHVREGMIGFLVEHGQSGLPRYRVEHFPSVPLSPPIGPIDDASIRQQEG